MNNQLTRKQQETLDLLLRGPRSAAELQQMVGQRSRAIEIILADLVLKGLVKRDGKRPTMSPAGGRPPVLYALCERRSRETDEVMRSSRNLSSGPFSILMAQIQH